MCQCSVVWVAFGIRQNLQHLLRLALLQQSSQHWVNLGEHLHRRQVLIRHHLLWFNFLDVADTHNLLLARCAVDVLFGACRSCLTLFLCVGVQLVVVLSHRSGKTLVLFGVALVLVDHVVEDLRRRLVKVLFDPLLEGQGVTATFTGEGRTSTVVLWVELVVGQVVGHVRKSFTKRSAVGIIQIVSSCLLLRAKLSPSRKGLLDGQHSCTQLTVEQHVRSVALTLGWTTWLTLRCGAKLLCDHLRRWDVLSVSTARIDRRRADVHAALSATNLVRVALHFRAERVHATAGCQVRQASTLEQI